MSVATVAGVPYTLRPSETLRFLRDAPAFLSDPNTAFTRFLSDAITGPSAGNTSITAQSVLEVSQAHMGVVLFKQQRDTSRLLAAFVYKTCVPDSVVPKGSRIRKTYKITDQREAQRGSYDTVVNGVQTKSYSQVFNHKPRVLSVQFGSLLCVAVPTEARELIARELGKVSTSWELTKTMEILRYCTAQPSLTDRVMIRTRCSDKADRLDAILTMAELMCGMVNAQPRSCLCALENARRVLKSDKSEVVVMGDSMFRVISSREPDKLNCSFITRERTAVSSTILEYTMANEKKVSPHEYDFTVQFTKGPTDVGGHHGGPCFPETHEMDVNYIHLGGGSTDKLPVVVVDGTKLEHDSQEDSSTEAKAFSNEGFKWEYFTVGCTSSAVSQLQPGFVLSGTSSDINYKIVASRSPRVSYIHQYDGALVPVELKELHPIANCKELFSRKHRVKLQQAVKSAITLHPKDPCTLADMIKLAKDREWYAKIKNKTSVLEFDQRHMLVPDKDAWTVRPRVALFNSSSMNNIENEFVQVGSELLAYMGQSQHTVKHLELIRQGLEHSHMIKKLIDSDTIVETCTATGSCTAGRLYWSRIADPMLCLALRDHLKEKEQGDPKKGNTPLTKDEAIVLANLENAVHEIVSNFRKVVGGRENSIVAYMPPPCTEISYDKRGTEDTDYCNLMYWVILPIMGARVYSAGSAELESSALVEYNHHKQRNLLEELDVDELTVNVVKGRCWFSLSCLAGMTDVTDTFEPTSTAPTSGFSKSVITYMWSTRCHMLHEVISQSIDAAVLLGFHYTTLVTPAVIQEHYDRNYYSGLSYLLFRGVRFTGCGMAVLPQNSALFVMGTKIMCQPTSHNTHQMYTLNQYREATVIPESLDSPGIYIPNMYMKDVKGGCVKLNTSMRDSSPYNMVVADAYNGFCPQSDSNTGVRGGYIFTTGRSDRLAGALEPDSLMQAKGYTCMPSLLKPLGSVFSNKTMKRGRENEQSNEKLFQNTSYVAEYSKSILEKVGDPFKSIADRVNNDSVCHDVMQATLGVAFCGTYGIGYGSACKLTRDDSDKSDSFADSLSPRISGTGLFACNPVQSTSKLITPIFNRLFGTSRRTWM